PRRPRCAARRGIRRALPEVAGRVRSAPDLDALGGCSGNHDGCGERSGGARREPRGQMVARSSLLRRIAALAALAPRLLRLAHHEYSDRLLDAAERALASAGRGGERGAGGRGGRAVITTGEVDAGGAPVVRVDAPHRLLGRVAARVAGDPSAALTLVGVTGTNGKTTTTYLLEAIWRAAGWHPGVVGTISYRFDGASQPAPLTTPDPIALQALLAEMRAAGTTHVALEVSSHALAQERVTGCRFDAAVFTNLTRDHLDFHGDLERYGAAKARLFLDELPAGGKRDPVAIVNVDDPAGARLAAHVRTRCVRVGRGAGADVRPLAAETSLAGTRGTLALGAERLPFESRLVGAPHLENILGAAAAAWALGTPLEAIARGLAAAEA